MTHVGIDVSGVMPRELTEQGASSADLTDPVAVAWTCQLVQLMVNGHDGILPQTWEADVLTRTVI